MRWEKPKNWDEVRKAEGLRVAFAQPSALITGDKSLEWREALEWRCDKEESGADVTLPTGKLRVDKLEALRVGKADLR